MDNVTSKTARKVHIPVGNRNPRTRVKSPAPASTTTEVFNRLRGVLLLGEETNVFIRRVVFAVDRQRFYKAQEYLPRLGYVTLDERLVWRATDKLSGLCLASVMPALEPQFGASNTHPGCVQVDCPLCGLRNRAWKSEDEARDWYFSTHIHESVAHL